MLVRAVDGSGNRGDSPDAADTSRRELDETPDLMRFHVIFRR